MPGRRYGRQHQRTRDALLPNVTPLTPCCRCSHPLGGGRIALDHNDEGTGYLGFAHDTPCPICGQRCNSRAGGQQAALRAGRQLRQRTCAVDGRPFTASFPDQQTCGLPACVAALRDARRKRRDLPPPPPSNARPW
jgi:hypothetical protein